MARLGPGDAAVVRELTRSLEVIDLARPSALAGLTPRLYHDLGLDCARAYSVAADEDEFRLGVFHAAGNPAPFAGLTRVVDQYLRGSRGRVGLYNPLRPEPAQRNRVIAGHTGQVIDAARARQVSSRFGIGARQLDQVQASAEHMTQSFRAMGVLDYHQMRVLVCDGSTMLAWVGGFCAEPPTARQRRMLGALVAPLRRRLQIEELMRANAIAQLVLATAMEQLPGAAYLTTPSGHVRHANAAGAQRLRRGRRSLMDAIAAAIHPSPDVHSAFRAIPIRDPGLPPHFLVIERAAHRIDAPARAAAAIRYGLTPRESDVLALLCRGASNKVIASELGCAERTVEVHVSHILAKLDVDSRAAAIAKLLDERNA